MLQQRAESVGGIDGGDYGERGVGWGDVVGQAGLDSGEEEYDDDGEDGPGPQLGAANRPGDCGRVEQHEGSGRCEQDDAVVPPVRLVPFDGVQGAGEDVEAEVLGNELLAEAVVHGEMPRSTAARKMAMPIHAELLKSCARQRWVIAKRTAVMGTTTAAAPLVIRAIAKPIQKRYQPFGSSC